MDDPEVIDPPGFNVAEAWGECKKYVDEMLAAGREIAAAFGADPGCCSCPACKKYYWAWGARQRCKACGFEFETDWWPMYSYGVQATRRCPRYRHSDLGYEPIDTDPSHG